MNVNAIDKSLLLEMLRHATKLPKAKIEKVIAKMDSTKATETPSKTA